MGWKTGLRRLCLVASLCFLALMPFDTGPSLAVRTRTHVDAIALNYRWQEANLHPSQIILPPDQLAAELGQTEILVVCATVATLLCLGLVGWVVAGFQRT
ncbi:MAG TPA: hypothetical protein VHY35_05930 [Stellaceae bacterium]|jgi:hypothetical protein|nr:hypothetical protein [Stellaceae bacterium]